jgi:hypothetical protein
MQHTTLAVLDAKAAGPDASVKLGLGSFFTLGRNRNDG